MIGSGTLPLAIIHNRYWLSKCLGHSRERNHMLLQPALQLGEGAITWRRRLGAQKTDNVINVDGSKRFSGISIVLSKSRASRNRRQGLGRAEEITLEIQFWKNPIALMESWKIKLRALAQDFLCFMTPWVAIVIYLTRTRALQEKQGWYQTAFYLCFAVKPVGAWDKTVFLLI